jgi:hypothetical protein
MQENKQKPSVKHGSSAYEIIFLGMLAVAVYIGGLLLLYFPIAFYMPKWFFGPLGCFIILGFDVIWVIGNRSWSPLKSRSQMTKKISSVLIFSLSTSVLSCWLVLNILGSFMW